MHILGVSRDNRWPSAAKTPPDFGAYSVLVQANQPSIVKQITKEMVTYIPPGVNLKIYEYEMNTNPAMSHTL